MRRNVTIAAIVALQLLMTLVTQIVIIRLVGVSPETDSLVAAQTVPAVIAAILVAALQSVWLPRLAADSADETRWQQTLAVALGQAAILAFLLCGLLVVTIGIWLPLLFPGFSSLQLSSANHFMLVLLGAAFFSIQSSQLAMALRTRERFYVAEFINLIGFFVSLVAIYLAIPSWGLTGVVWIILGRSFLIFLMQLKFSGWPKISIKSGWQSRETWSLMKPIFAGASLYKTTPLVDRYWTSLSPVGSITVYNLAQMAIMAITTILDRSINATITAKFGLYVRNCNYKELTNRYRKGALSITVIAVLIVLALFVAKHQIIFMLEWSMKLDPATAGELWAIIVLLSGQLYVAVIGVVLVAVYYALGDTRTPSLIGISGFFFGVILKWMLFYSMGIRGLALATSAYFMVNFMFFVFFLEPKLGRMKNSHRSDRASRDLI